MPFLTCPADGGRSGHSLVSRPKAEALPSSSQEGGSAIEQRNADPHPTSRTDAQVCRTKLCVLGKPWLCLYPLASSSRGKMGGIISESCGRDPTNPGPQAKGAKEF